MLFSPGAKWLWWLGYYHMQSVLSIWIPEIAWIGSGPLSLYRRWWFCGSVLAHLVLFSGLLLLFFWSVVVISQWAFWKFLGSIPPFFCAAFRLVVCGFLVVFSFLFCSGFWLYAGSVLLPVGVFVVFGVRPVG